MIKHEDETKRVEWICRKGHSNPHVNSTCKECDNLVYNFNNQNSIRNEVRNINVQRTSKY